MESPSIRGVSRWKACSSSGSRDFTQHQDGISHAEIVEAVREEVIGKVLPEHMVDENTLYHINPTGRFVVGPNGDCGLTGRKIIVDTYGGWDGMAEGIQRKGPSRSTARLRTSHATSRKRCGVWIGSSMRGSGCIRDWSCDPVSVLVDTMGTEAFPMRPLRKRSRQHSTSGPQPLLKASTFCGRFSHPHRPTDTLVVKRKRSPGSARTRRTP